MYILEELLFRHEVSSILQLAQKATSITAYMHTRAQSGIKDYAILTWTRSCSDDVFFDPTKVRSNWDTSLLISSTMVYSPSLSASFSICSVWFKISPWLFWQSVIDCKMAFVAENIRILKREHRSGDGRHFGFSVSEAPVSSRMEPAHMPQSKCKPNVSLFRILALCNLEQKHHQHHMRISSMYDHIFAALSDHLRYQNLQPMIKILLWEPLGAAWFRDFGPAWD